MSTPGTVQKLAALARIRVPEDRTAIFEKEFESILNYISQLDSLTLTHTSTPKVPVLHNVFRDDATPTPPGTWTEKLVRAFPKRSGNALSVKKIISND